MKRCHSSIDDQLFVWTNSGYGVTPTLYMIIRLGEILENAEIFNHLDQSVNDRKQRRASSAAVNHIHIHIHHKKKSGSNFKSRE